MSDPRSSGIESALRQLHGAEAELAALRQGAVTTDEARGYVLRVANSVDRALRRLLRDDDRVELSVRLQALAPDELSSPDVLSELRRSERLSMSTAAAVHELLEARRRLERGGGVEGGDAQRAITAVERLEPEIRRHPRPTEVADATQVFDDRDIDLEPVGAAPRRVRRGGFPLWAGAGALVLILIAFAAWALTNRGPSQLDQGIALFRSGAYADAANHFWRFAEENPDDATPHLYLARIHRRMERPELAAEALREAQRLAPEDPGVHRELGFLLLDTGRADVAVERFERAIEMEPESSEGWVGLIRALRESGRAAEVPEVLQEAPAEVRALLEQPGTS